MKTNVLVEKALKEYPATRNSDKLLMMYVWWQQDNDFLHNFKEFFLTKAHSPESITRARRKFQEHGLYPASDKVNEARYSKFKEMRYSMGDE